MRFKGTTDWRRPVGALPAVNLLLSSDSVLEILIIHGANQPADAGTTIMAKTQNGRQTVPGASLRFVSHWPVLETACSKFQWRFTCLSPPPGCPDLRRGRRPAPPACLSAGLVASQGKHEVPGVLRREGNGYVGVEIRSHRLELEVRRRQRLCGPPPGRGRVWSPPRGANCEPRRRQPVVPLPAGFGWTTGASRTPEPGLPQTRPPAILRFCGNGGKSNGTGPGLPEHGVKENELLAQAAKPVRR